MNNVGRSFMDAKNTAKLTNGEIVGYDACGETPETYDHLTCFSFIGKGFIYSIDGVRQRWTEADEQISFFRRI